MPQSSPLDAIEAALARAANDDNATTDNVKHWLDLRKQCLEQNGQRNRDAFWNAARYVFIILVALAVVGWVFKLLFLSQGAGR